MKISFNPSNSNKNILDLIKNNKDIIFDLKGHSIFARGVEFKGTDTNTWRPVVDNLTSDSTTSSLSAKQGRVLKALIDGKSNSDHNHDGRYLKLTGGTMASNALITFADSGSWDTSKEPQGARGGLYWTGQSDYAKLYAEETAGDNLDLVIQFGDDNSNGLSIRNKANTQTSYISSSGVITTGTFKGNLDWSYITNKPATATRWPSWAEVTGKPSSFTPSTHTHGLSNSVFFLNMPSINGNAKWKEVFGYPVNYNLLLSVRINDPAPEWCVGYFGSGILYGGNDTKGFMSSAFNEPFIMWAGGNGSSDDSVPKWYIGIKGTHKSIYNLATIASEANAAYNLRHSHANKSVLDGITSALVNSWNTAYNFVSNITGTADGRYVRAFGTSNDNIDSDWGQSFKTFDPIPLGTPPEKNPNISLLSIGENFNRRKQLAFIWDNDNIYYRRRVDSGFTNWRRLAFANEIPTSLKNPYALTISLNGTSQGPYDGSAAKNINITPGSIGAAVSNHSHDYLVVNSADDKSFNSAYHNFQVLYAGEGNGITGKPANVNAFGLFKFRAASGWSGQMLLANGGSLYIRSSEDAKMTNTLAWKTILDSSNYSGILDSRYYTESEVNSLLNAKLDRQNLSYGNWNPRGYHLAADYHYNGGDLSISENNGKMYVSVDGCFWQNEGQYRVLDTSDIGDIQGSVTLHQYLGATDAAWYPLVWGGNVHTNTSDSTGAVYKSYDKLRWQTSSQTLYATNIQTNNIKNLSIGGGIYWNSYVESASDGSDAASITLVRSGVAGGTTLVLSQMNDTNDTIQFKTNTAARLYHNSYPILTTQDTYVNNNKGYINGTEITQVNNADTLDGYHAASFVKMKQFRFNQYEEGFWTKILTITINSTSDLQPVIAFNWIPSECAREVWAEFTINWRNNSPIFYAIWKGTAVRTLTCVNSSGNIWNVWVQGDKYSYDPFGEVQVTYAHNISSYNGGSLGYSDSDPGGTRCTLGGYVNYARSTGNADTVDGQHASAFSYKSWWHWYGKDGQPNWLWGGNNENDYYVYNPSNFRVAYAASAGNADTLDGYPANGSNDRPYGHIPTIESDGVMEVGRYIDFHNDNNGKHDFSTRLQSTGNYGNEVNLPSASGTLALINDVNNYYWANVKISTSSSTTTSPTFSNVYLGNSLYLNTRGSNSIYNGPNDSANGVGGPLNNLVFSSWYGVSFTTSCAGLTYTNKNAVSINCRTGQLYAREVQANGFMHTDHNNNDAVLLAGGGYKTLKDFIFLNKSYNYTDREHYNLTFHKLSGICNNLVWVDGYVKGIIAKFFVIDPAVFPYRYDDDDPNLNTIYLMGGENYITINAVGAVIINNATGRRQRVGFFYIGGA